MKFVCSFAWTDLKVTEEERSLVANLARGYGFDDEEIQQIGKWLAVPPPPEDVDPLDIPREHRQLFYDAAKGMVAVDGRVVPGEQETLALFRELLQE